MAEKEYIDKDRIILCMNDWMLQNAPIKDGDDTIRADTILDAISMVEDSPAADVEPVRHGHWVTEKEAEDKDDYLLRDTCSVCGHCDWDCIESAYFNYCPNCGARMDGGTTNDKN